MNAAMKTKRDRAKSVRWFVAFVLGCLVMVAVSCVRAAAPTGFDVMRVELPQLGYAQLLAGCTFYDEPESETVAWCLNDDYRDALTPHAMPRSTAVWGVLGPVFAWFPSWGACRLVDRTEYPTYTAITLSCSTDDMFATGFGD
jgi:hypothetical protein